MINIEIQEKGYFNLDSNEYYEGYHIKDTRWNGFATPSFEREIADIIAHNCSTSDFKIGYDEDKDCYIVTEYEGIMILNTYSFKKHTIETPEGRKEVYPMGAYYWTWNDYTLDEVKNKEDTIIFSNVPEMEDEYSIDINS